MYIRSKCVRLFHLTKHLLKGILLWKTKSIPLRDFFQSRAKIKFSKVTHDIVIAYANFKFSIS